MGVYIKNIELPKHDDEYVIFTVYGDGGVVYGPLNRPHVRYKNRAVPIPPHGRLGDLDKLVEKIDGIWDCNDMVFEPDDHCCNVPEDCKGCKWAQTKDFFQRMVENAPTIIPAEEGE